MGEVAQMCSAGCYGGAERQGGCGCFQEGTRGGCGVWWRWGGGGQAMERLGDYGWVGGGGRRRGGRCV